MALKTIHITTITHIHISRSFSSSKHKPCTHSTKTPPSPHSTNFGVPSFKKYLLSICNLAQFSLRKVWVTERREQMCSAISQIQSREGDQQDSSNRRGLTLLTAPHSTVHLNLQCFFEVGLYHHHQVLGKGRCGLHVGSSSIWTTGSDSGSGHRNYVETGSLNEGWPG